MQERHHLEAAIEALEAQRPALGDAVVNAALGPLRQRLAEALANADEDARVLRQVSVLFTDVVQSTRLARDLDPEDIQAVMDGALARFRRVVEAQGGRALQYAGDSMLAAFGTRGASEAHAEQAVRAGLSILAEARSHAEVVAAAHGLFDFAVRVGIHTGTVLLGGGADGDNTIRGHAVNVAARMEQSAPAGTLRISHATLALVRGLFDVVEQPPVVFKDHDMPVRSWLVRGARDRADAADVHGIEGVTTPMIGREAELDALRAAFGQASSGKRPVFATVVGEAGVGKSRLRREFERWLAARAEPVVVLRGQAREEARGRPFALLRDILARRLALDDNDSMAAARDKIEHGVADVLAGDPAIGDAAARANAHLLGHLIGIDFAASPHVAGVRHDARQVRSIGLLAAMQWLRRLAVEAAAPLVLLIDDLQWADAESLDFVASLEHGGDDLPPTLVVGLSRPRDAERPDDGVQWPAGPRIALQTLDGGAKSRLGEALLQRLDPVPPSLLALLIERAEGNPYYMEELVKMLVDDGALEVAEPHWRFAPERLRLERIPASLTGVLQARLDRLEAAEKRALQQAAVVGPVFWEEALAAIAPAAIACLPGLQRKGLIVEHAGSALDATRELAFTHQLLHRVTYDTLLKPARRETHRRAAEWLASRAESRPDFLAAVGEHYDSAGERNGAIGYFLRAAEHAAGRYANAAAEALATRALVLIDSAGDTPSTAHRWRAEVVRERVTGAVSRREAQRSAIEALEAISAETGSATQRAFAACRRSEYLMRLGEFAEALRQGREAQAMAETAGEDELALRAQTRVAAVLHYLGRSDECIAVARAGVAAAQRLALPPLEALFLNAISVASFQTNVGEALRAEERQAEICTATGNRNGLATAVCNIGASLLVMGDLQASERALHDGLKRAREIGDRQTEAYPLLNLSQIAWRRGDGGTALAFADEALGICRQIGDRLKASGALYWLGNAQLLLGRSPEAAKSFEEAWGLGVELRHSQRFDAAAGLARIALAADDVATALEWTETVLAHHGGGGTLAGSDTPALIWLTCRRALERAGDPRAAATLSFARHEVERRAEAIAEPHWRASFLALAENRATFDAAAAAGGVEP
jgi:class 3 adenylate cyclase/tetratricopeptide (TPR) repeat protein